MDRAPGRAGAPTHSGHPGLASWTRRPQPPTQPRLHCQLNPPAQALWGPGPGVIRGSEKAEAEAGQTLLPQDEREEAQYPQMVPSLTPAASGHGDGAG